MEDKQGCNDRRRTSSITWKDVHCMNNSFLIPVQTNSMIIQRFIVLGCRERAGLTCFLTFTSVFEISSDCYFLLACSLMYELRAEEISVDYWGGFGIDRFPVSIFAVYNPHDSLLTNCFQGQEKWSLVFDIFVGVEVAFGVNTCRWNSLMLVHRSCFSGWSYEKKNLAVVHFIFISDHAWLIFNSQQ